jgi:hypothetical protein
LGFTDCCVKTVSHGDVSRSYGSTIFFAPEQNIAVIVLANSYGQTLLKPRHKAMEMLLPVELETNAKPKSISLTTGEAGRSAGKFAHARRKRGKFPPAA